MEAQELAEELGIDLNATSSSAAAAPRDSNSMLPDVDPNLQALIRGRNQSKFDSLIAGLEARYAAPAPKAGKRKRVAKK